MGDDDVFYNTDCTNCFATDAHDYEDYCLPNIYINSIEITNPTEIESGSCGSNGNESGDYDGWIDTQS